jgi:hypothetical protein
MIYLVHMHSQFLRTLPEIFVGPFIASIGDSLGKTGVADYCYRHLKSTVLSLSILKFPIILELLKPFNTTN